MPLLCATGEILAANTDYPHTLDYCLDRPRGLQDTYVFIHFLTPCELGTAAGVLACTRGDCILYAPGFPQYNRARAVPLRNNWLHFRGGAPLRRRLRELALPLNVRFRPRDDRAIEPHLHAITTEIYQRRPHYPAALALRLELFLLELARQLEGGGARPLTPSVIAHAEAFRNLRARLQEHPEAQWDIPRMAAEVCLSRSRFCALYKQLFRIEPGGDLIAARLRMACQLLSGSNLTVDAVAARCGFRSAIHFHRLFKKHFRATPREYCANDALYSGQHHLEPSAGDSAQT